MKQMLERSGRLSLTPRMPTSRASLHQHPAEMCLLLPPGRKLLRLIPGVAWIGSPFLLWRSNIPLYGCTMTCLPIHLLMNVLVVSTIWLLWTKLLQTFVYKFLCGPVFSFPLDTYLGVELLCHVVYLCLAFGDVYNLVACTCLLPGTQHGVEVECDWWGTAWFMPCLHSFLAGDLRQGTNFLRWTL